MIILGVSWCEFKTNFVILRHKTSENVEKDPKFPIFGATDTAFRSL
jgi:hypothetical protein